MPPGTYIQAAIGELHRKYQLGDIWYLDMWPVGLAMMMTCGPETTAISTTANIYPQASVVGEFFKSSTGTSFIEALNGNPWKQLHQMLAPGLTPGAVKTYFSDVVSRAAVLNRRLQRAAASGDIIDLYRMLSHYPAEVIGKVVFGEDVDAEGADAQLCEDLMVTAEKAGVANGTINPWTAWLMNRDIKRRVARISRNVEARVHRRFAELKQKKVLPNRSTATNLLDRMLVARVESGLPMDDALMTLLMDK